MSYGPYGTPSPYSPALPAYGTDPTAVLGRRYLAYIIDAIIAGVLIGIVLFAGLHSVDTGGDPNFCNTYKTDHPTTICIPTGNNTARVGQQLGAVYGVGGVVWLLNMVLLEGLVGGTLGKLACGIRVVKHDGQLCGIGRALGRNLMLVVDGFGLCLALPGIISSSVSKGHRRLGDMVAGTLVVSASQVGKPLYVPGVTVPEYGGYAGYGQPAPYPSGPYPSPGGYGVGGPYPSATPPAQAAPGAQPDYQADAPTWDPKRNTYIQYDTARAAWLEYDQAAGEWKPISQ